MKVIFQEGALVMKRWIPQTPAPPPQRWQSRKEILNEYLDSLSPEEMLRTRPYYWALRYGPGGYARKYDPNQPRVPAGNADGGQWTSDQTNLSMRDPSSAVGQPASYQLAAASGKQSPAYCWNQMLIDFLYCGALRPRSRVAACRSQAMERYAACLRGNPIPPLPF